MYNGGTMMTERKTVPKFRTEDEEREFWAAHDSTDYVDWQDARRIVLANLEPSLHNLGGDKKHAQ